MGKLIPGSALQIPWQGKRSSFRDNKGSCAAHFPFLSLL